MRIPILASALLAAAMSLPVTAQEYRPRVDGLACAYCAYGIEKAFLRSDGVEHVDIDFERGLVIVRTRPEVRFDEARLRQIVHDAGFTLRDWQRVEAPAGADAQRR